VYGRLTAVVRLLAVSLDSKFPLHRRTILHVQLEFAGRQNFTFAENKKKWLLEEKSVLSERLVELCGDGSHATFF
jgi:hypothetical protein